MRQQTDTSNKDKEINTGKEDINNIPQMRAHEEKVGVEYYGTFHNVELKPVFYRSLIETFGKEKAELAIEELSCKIAEGADPAIINSTNHFATLRYWLLYQQNNPKGNAAQPKKTAWKVDLNALKI